MKCKRLIEMAQPEVEKELSEKGLLVIPTGSVEQHGPHLPMGTDYYAIDAVAERVAARLDGLLVPFPAVGVTPFHMGFAGTISLTNETFMGLFKDICRSLFRHGARQAVVVNWHEGNTPALNTACMDLQIEYPEVVFVISQACYVGQQLFREVSDLTHAGLLEVLPVLGRRPDLVHLERADNPSPLEKAQKMDALRRRREAHPIIPDIRMMYETGWYGDLSRADRDLAETFLERVSEAVTEGVLDSLEQMKSAGK